jgi:hypothetical protein
MHSNEFKIKLLPECKELSSQFFNEVEAFSLPPKSEDELDFTEDTFSSWYLSLKTFSAAFSELLSFTCAALL